MTDAERRLIGESVAAWSRAGPELERVRRENIRRTDTMRDLRAFRGLAVAALRASGGAASSGLVEQQAWFQRLRERSAS